MRFFFFNDPAPTDIYTFPTRRSSDLAYAGYWLCPKPTANRAKLRARNRRSEEHTSELQSPYDLVCRLLLEKKNAHHSCVDRTLKSEVIADRHHQMDDSDGF